MSSVVVVFCELSLTVAVFPKLSSQIAVGIIGPLDRETRWWYLPFRSDTSDRN